MNYHVIGKLLGLLLFVFALSMTPSLAWSFYYADGAALAIIASMLIGAGAGAGLFLWGRRQEQEVFRREATLVVALAWILSSTLGALPYYFAEIAEMENFVDCFFESTSGLTTTGSSILANIEAVPQSILFWRSWTHWVGGVGIVMMFIAILPYLGAGGRMLVKTETTGPVKDGLTPRIRDTARLLLQLYMIYTVSGTILLMLAGMTFFDALCHTFGAIATGGFSTKNLSVAAYDSVLIEFILIVFMILGATNFALAHKALRGKPWLFWRDPEWRFFIVVLGGAVLLNLLIVGRSGVYESGVETLRHTLFVTTSITTTTGYGTADYEVWPASAQIVLMMLMFVAGNAGSTCGGIKNLRFVILFKTLIVTLERVYRPNTIRKIKIGGSTISADLQSSTLIFILAWILVFVLSGLAVAVIEGGSMDMITPFGAVAATINGVGPGFSLVGPTENFSGFAPASKWVLAFVMILGRLELYSLLVLFVPRFWREA